MSSRFFEDDPGRSSAASWVRITRPQLERNADLKMVYDFVMFQFISSGDQKNFLRRKVAAKDWSGLSPSLKPMSVEFVMENRLEGKDFLVTMIVSTRAGKKKILYILIRPLDAITMRDDMSIRNDERLRAFAGYAPAPYASISC